MTQSGTYAALLCFVSDVATFRSNTSNVSPKSWAALAYYCSAGRAEIYNWVAGRTPRGVGLRRRNYLLAGADSGGERAAAMYSLIGTARLNGLDPEAYLAYVLERIVDHPINRIDELLPWCVAPSLLSTAQVEPIR
ncbi:hypothetical protein J2793_007129 [Paraburkholderia caledonica]|uniref:Transposase IS66 C-terminal domain-containing protein n=1 Tax=Paraburkholderia caledonica TaxID=134536 RepID=A0AB73INS8_9BURK|nr:hypothetical protein [Paraburkholderia caledonica]